MKAVGKLVLESTLPILLFLSECILQLLLQLLKQPVASACRVIHAAVSSSTVPPPSWVALRLAMRSLARFAPVLAQPLKERRFRWAVLGAGALAGGYMYRPPACKDLRVVSLQELRAHNNLEDGLWVSYLGHVYDVTHFAKIHPGGPGRIQMAGGSDLQKYFDVYHVHPNASCLDMLDVLTSSRSRSSWTAPAWLAGSAKQRRNAPTKRPSSRIPMRTSLPGA